MNKTAISRPRGRADGSEQVHGGRSCRHCFRGDRRGARKGRGGADRRVRYFRDAKPCRAYGQESAHRRERADTGLEITVVQGGETAEGGGEAGLARGARAEPGDDRHGRPGSAGAMLEMSDWPGGVEPVWTLLESESMEALRAEPSDGQPGAAPRGRSAGRGTRGIGVRAQCADRAAAHKRRVLADGLERRRDISGATWLRRCARR